MLACLLQTESLSHTQRFLKRRLQLQRVCLGFTQIETVSLLVVLKHPASGNRHCGILSHTPSPGMGLGGEEHTTCAGKVRNELTSVKCRWGPVCWSWTLCQGVLLLGPQTSRRIHVSMCSGTPRRSFLLPPTTELLWNSRAHTLCPSEWLLERVLFQVSTWWESCTTFPSPCGGHTWGLSPAPVHTTDTLIPCPQNKQSDLADQGNNCLTPRELFKEEWGGLMYLPNNNSKQTNKPKPTHRHHHQNPSLRFARLRHLLGGVTFVLDSGVPVRLQFGQVFLPFKCFLWEYLLIPFRRPHSLKFQGPPGDWNRVPDLDHSTCVRSCVYVLLGGGLRGLTQRGL